MLVWVDWLARLYSTALNALSLAALAALTVVRPRSVLGASQPHFLFAITLTYGAGAALGSPYDARIAWVLDLLCVLTVVAAYSTAMLSNPAASRRPSGGSGASW